MLPEVVKLDSNNPKIDRIDNGILGLINLSNITRYKNIDLQKSFSAEFFANIKNYINLQP